ncbi:MAG: restriction endonuclease [Lachnospiraceae bacterium]|nr:restriction endonuclease [Lachnospiraceae bacterium]
MMSSFIIPLIAAAAGCLILAGIIAAVRRIRHRHDIDELDGIEFEHYCAELLAGTGFLHVRTTSASRDFGADILAQKDGVTYAVQCKRYDKPVGIYAVQEIYAAKDFYGMMVGAVMTNSTFTAPAKQMAEKLGILLWDGDDLKRRFSRQ